MAGVISRIDRSIGDVREVVCVIGDVHRHIGPGIVGAEANLFDVVEQGTSRDQDDKNEKAVHGHEGTTRHSADEKPDRIRDVEDEKEDALTPGNTFA